MSSKTSSSPTKDLSVAIQGVWWLLSRQDYTKDGKQRVDPIMGSDPIGILAYAKDRFSAQFMKRDRNGAATTPIIQQFGKNNTIAADGYDAYFGIYAINEKTGKVTHTLMGSITPANIGITVSRELLINEDKLTIRLETSTHEGEFIIRTLLWERIS